MSNDNRSKVNVAQLVHQHEDERHLMDYVRVIYKRRWVAIPRPARRLRGWRHQQLPHDAAVSGEHAAADREGQPEGRRPEHDLPAAGRLVQRRLLSDAVPGSCRAEASRDARRPSDAARSSTRPCAKGCGKSGRPGPWRGAVRGAWALASRWSAGGSNGRRSRARPAQKDDDPSMRYAGMVLGALGVTPIRNSRLVDISMTVHGSAAGGRPGQRAREGLHRAKPRVSLLGLQGRHRLARGAAGRAAEEGRGERGRTAALQGTARRRRRRGPTEHRRPAAVRSQQRRHEGQDDAHRKGGALQPAAVDSEQQRASTRSRRSWATSTSRS